MRFFINGVDFNKCKITQDENGVYFENNKDGSLWGTILAKFTQSKAPLGYTKKFNGSHTDTNYYGVNVKRQRPLDISGVKGAVITSDADLKVEGIYGSGTQKYGVVSVGKVIFGIKRWKFFFVHTSWKARVGTVIKAGKPICTINYHHVHAFCQNLGFPYSIRKLILSK